MDIFEHLQVAWYVIMIVECVVQVTQDITWIKLTFVCFFSKTTLMKELNIWKGETTQ